MPQPAGRAARRRRRPAHGVSPALPGWFRAQRRARHAGVLRFQAFSGARRDMPETLPGAAPVCVRDGRRFRKNILIFISEDFVMQSVRAVLKCVYSGSIYYMQNADTYVSFVPYENVDGSRIYWNISGISALAELQNGPEITLQSTYDQKYVDISNKTMTVDGEAAIVASLSGTPRTLDFAAQGAAIADNVVGYLGVIPPRKLLATPWAVVGPAEDQCVLYWKMISGPILPAGEASPTSFVVSTV